MRDALLRVARDSPFYRDKLAADGARAGDVGSLDDFPTRRPEVRPALLSRLRR